MTFAEYLKRRLDAASITQAELARRAGLTRAAISAIMTGKNTNPRLDTVLKITTVLDINADEMLSEIRDSI